MSMSPVASRYTSTSHFPAGISPTSIICFSFSRFIKKHPSPAAHPSPQSKPVLGGLVPVSARPRVPQLNAEVTLVGVLVGVLVGAKLVGAKVVGARVVGALVVGARVVGASVVGARVVGALVVGALVVGARVVG